MTLINCLVAHVAHIHGAQRDRNLNFRISVVYGTVVRPQAQDVGRARVSLRGSTATQVAKSSGHGIVHCEKESSPPLLRSQSFHLPQKLRPSLLYTALFLEIHQDRRNPLIESILIPIACRVHIFKRFTTTSWIGSPSATKSRTVFVFSRQTCHNYILDRYSSLRYTLTVITVFSQQN